MTLTPGFSDLVTALGLVLVLEGLIYALFPEQLRRFVAVCLSLPPNQLRIGGVMAVAFGVGVVWVVRG